MLKILLRKAGTAFYMNSGDWTEDVKKAHAFNTGSEVIDFAVKENLNGIEVFYDFGNPRYSFSIGVR